MKDSIKCHNGSHYPHLLNNYVFNYLNSSGLTRIMPLGTSCLSRRVVGWCLLIALDAYYINFHSSLCISFNDETYSHVCTWPSLGGCHHIPTLNVCDLILFVGVADYEEGLNMRTSRFQERGSDGGLFGRIHIGPLSRVMARRMEEEERLQKTLLLWSVIY